MAAEIKNTLTMQATDENGQLPSDKVDIAQGFVGDANQVLEVDLATRSRIRRKIDMRILPLLCLTTMVQFLDKSTLSYASIFGILADANLKGNEFSWLASIFYFGYLGMQPIGAYLLQKFPPSKCLAFSVFLWAVILFLHIPCDSFGKLVAVRFFLGAAEAVVTPAFLLICSAWYTRQDQPLRMGIWFCFNGVSLIVGGILSYGIGQIDAGGLASWKWLFIIIGLISVVWSIVLFFFLPDSQLTASFFDEDEKRAAIEMVRSNNTGIHNKAFNKYHLMEALLDVKTWVFFWLALLFNIPNSIATFGSLVIQNFGFSTLNTTLLGMPAGVLEILVMIPVTWLCITKRDCRIWGVLAGVLISLLGFAMVFAVPFDNKAALLVGYYLIYAFPTGYILVLAVASANTAGHTKKVTVNAILLIGYCVGNIAGPQFYKMNQKPRYQLGIGANLACMALIFVTLVLLRFYLQWQNKRREPNRMAVEVSEDAGQRAFLDLTDKGNPHFIYVY